ncbi:hypothetical protein NliqN6_5180 [Naganishia liquefaciens]|uniref:Uncharacterized protein n=1 Tax=Naganishia liquefaciens TaxID=104408 RepID=A0A8H3YGY1_9TREE|nr:hypothetical protein NliqN6_5180 [Naganishia liquefaciens]
MSHTQFQYSMRLSIFGKGGSNELPREYWALSTFAHRHLTVARSFRYTTCSSFAMTNDQKNPLPSRNVDSYFWDHRLHLSVKTLAKFGRICGAEDSAAGVLPFGGEGSWRKTRLACVDFKTHS